jgi:hypothetical protein
VETCFGRDSGVLLFGVQRYGVFGEGGPDGWSESAGERHR